MVAVSILCACGGDDGGPNGSGAGWDVSYGEPAVAFAQDDGFIYRWIDLDGDGDYNEANERSEFLADPSAFFKPMVALDGRTLIMVFNSPSANTGQVRWLQDANGDGDAQDPGESRLVFSGTLPGGTLIARMQSLALARDGSLYVSDQVVGGVGQTIYRLTDANGDGDTDDLDEVVVVTTVPSAIHADTLALDGNDELWFVGSAGSPDDGADLYRVRSGVPALVIERAALSAARGLLPVPFKLDVLGDGSIAFSGREVADLSRKASLAALVDSNHDREIATNEVTTIWNFESGEFDCTFQDLKILEDGSILVLSYKRLIRLVDGNGDGDFLDLGETYVAFDPVFAEANGQSEPQHLSRITATTKP